MSSFDRPCPCLKHDRDAWSTLFVMYFAWKKSEKTLWDLIRLIKNSGSADCKTSNNKHFNCPPLSNGVCMSISISFDLSNMDSCHGWKLPNLDPSDEVWRPQCQLTATGTLGNNYCYDKPPKYMIKLMKDAAPDRAPDVSQQRDTREMYIQLMPTCINTKETKLEAQAWHIWRPEKWRTKKRSHNSREAQWESEADIALANTQSHRKMYDVQWVKFATLCRTRMCISQVCGCGHLCNEKF